MSESRQDITLKDIELAVAKDRDGRLDVPDRLKVQDPLLGKELVILALYKAFKRRGATHTEAVEYTKEMFKLSKVKIIYG